MSWSNAISLTYILIFLSSTTIRSQPQFENSDFEPFKMAVIKNSNCIINGSTNISNFTCNYTFTQSDTSNCSSRKIGDNFVFDNTKIKINVNTLSCGNPLITSDLKKALEINRHPTITLEINKIADHESDPIKPNQAHATLTIKGKEKKIKVNVGRFKDKQNLLKFNGSFQVNLSDFDIKEIKKAGGIISVEDQILIDYDIKLWVKKNAP